MTGPEWAEAADPVRTRVLVITGLSGAGRSQAADHLESLGWLAIHNLPPGIVPDVTRLVTSAASSADRVALSVGAGSSVEDFLTMLAWLRSAPYESRVVFLDATTEILVRRFDETRRSHPLSSGSDQQHLMAAIEDERRLLARAKGEADVVLDTSALSTHELRRRIGLMFAGTHAGSGAQLTLMSFGYKHGLPLDADLVLDCRFLPNPHWVEHLRPQTGLEQEVGDYVLGRPGADDFLTDLVGLLDRLLPRYASEGRAYLTISLGCTGGRHRSVAMTEELASRLRAMDVRLSVLHRDVEK
ncbi:RNase adapter RapZ [Streptomyces sp. NPDC102441]|uniref:RNase adapter RapZ n=1 Tax=Streptomyces sp. NPDC102441 TaxID=3366176 RepID=UPI00380A03DE